jgi:DNA mismatch repair protein PMS2
MELTASDELLTMENLDVLRQNGFEVEVDGEGESGQGCRLKLIAQPISKSTIFDVKGWL